MTQVAAAPHFLGGGAIEFRDREYPAPGEGQLLLRVEANAVCGTDRDQYFEGSRCIPGHEAAGTVIDCGPGTRTEVGTRGAVFLMDYCDSCRSCRLGYTNQCLAKRNDMGFTADGGYGPYELVQESCFIPVPQELDGVDATLLLDVMGTTGHALNRIGLVRPDIDSLYIAGAGPIGLGAVAMATIRLGKDVPVYISDFQQSRLDLAAQLGAYPIHAADAAAIAALPDIDAAIDSTGNTMARRTALEVLGKRGVLACVGHGQGLELEVSSDLIAPERAVLGSEYFRYDECERNLADLLAHTGYLRQIITHRVPRAQIADAFELFLSGATGKVVVVGDPA